MNLIKKIILKFKRNGVKYVLKEDVPRIFYHELLCLVAKITRNKPLKDIIIIQSHGDFDCNGGALYEYFLKNGYNQKYKIVWLLRHDIPKNLPYNVEAYSYHSKSIKKGLRICFAKYFFADDLITKKVRNDQKSIYCTHGGFSLKDVRGKIDLKGKRIDYVLLPSQNCCEIMVKNFNVNEKETEIITLGYPWQDTFYEKTSNEYNKIITKTFKKNILWMPTFRRGSGDRNDSEEEFPFGVPLFKTKKMFNDLNELLYKADVLLTIKIHPSQNPVTYKDLKDLSNIKIITPEKERELKLNKYNLMKYTDALISDYSAVAYEYLLLNRPIAFVTNDIKSYKLGFIVENIEDYMPGKEIKNYADFFEFIENIINEYDEYAATRTDLLNYLYEYRKGDSCKRLVEFLGIKN